MQTVAEIISVIGPVFRHTGVFPNFPTCRCRPGPGWLCVRTGAAPDFCFGGVLLVAILRLGRFLPVVDEGRDDTSPRFVDERPFAGLRRGNVAVKIVSDGRFRFLPGRNGSDLQAMVVGNNGWRAGSWTRNDISSSVCGGAVRMFDGRAADGLPQSDRWIRMPPVSCPEWIVVRRTGLFTGEAGEAFPNEMRR